MPPIIHLVSFREVKGNGKFLLIDFGTYLSEWLGTTDNTPGLVPPRLKLLNNCTSSDSVDRIPTFTDLSMSLAIILFSEGSELEASLI